MSTLFLSHTPCPEEVATKDPVTGLSPPTPPQHVDQATRDLSSTSGFRFCRGRSLRADG